MRYNIKTMIKNAMQRPEISFWLAIIIPIVGVAVSWGVMSTKLSSLEERFNFFGGRYESHVTQAEERFDSQDMVFLDIQIRLAEIQKDIVFIKENLKDHRSNE